jgi:glycosyltransferase involved in cell wall biosynthesis
MVSHVPLIRELGAGRVQLELAEEMRALGHDVQTFDARDAGGRRGFEKAAREFVKAHRASFDVVDAHHGALPYSKRDLGLDGLLVARTSGLYSFYVSFRRMELRRWRKLVPGNRFAHMRLLLRDQLSARRCRASLEHADLLLPLTRAEQWYIRQRLGITQRCVPIPNGLTDRHAEALAAAALPSSERLRAREVAFIGAWSARKGAADWPRIIDRTRALAPGARFRFVGTGSPDEIVRRDLGGAGAWVDIVPSYRAEELPSLLARSTAAALPSYTEGWGLGLLEGLAAGLPSAAYDVSGPHAMLGHTTPSQLVAPGDTDGLAELLATALNADTRAYEELSRRALEVAGRFRWPTIAADTISAYNNALQDL